MASFLAWAVLIPPLALGQDSGTGAQSILVVGDEDYRPLTYLAAGRPSGLDVELVQALEPWLHRSVRVELMKWDLAQEKVRSGDADVLLAVSVSEERKATYDFTSPLFEHEFALFFRSGEVSNLDDLAGRRVGVTRGGFPREALEHKPGVTTVPVEGYRDGFDRLSAGAIDAFACDLWVGAETIRANHLSGIATSGRPFARQRYALAVRKGNTALLAELDRALAAARKEGTLARLEQRWRPDEMVFAPRHKVREIVGLALGGLALLLFGLMAVWITALKRHARAQRQAQAEREAALRELDALRAQLEEENLYLKEEIDADSRFDGIVGESDALRYVLTRIGQVAPSDATVLVLGETGVGKELVARAIHERSRRAELAFVRVNCAALPASIAESELFGHEAGAFTGAARLRKGRFELANGGTLFLDEVGELLLDLQAKLLRVLQEGEFERVGSSESLKVNVRVIAASNRDLRSEVAAGRFRQDLFYRLNIFPLTVPPLRDRREDIPLLVRHFLPALAARSGKQIREVPAAVLRVLGNYEWPGNVRELRNVLERAVLQSSDDVLRLAERLESGSATAAAGPQKGQPLRYDEAERVHIRSVLALTRGRVNGPGGAAELLGVNPNTLRSRMKKLGVQPARPAKTKSPADTH